MSTIQAQVDRAKFNARAERLEMVAKRILTLAHGRFVSNPNPDVLDVLTAALHAYQSAYYLPKIGSDVGAERCMQRLEEAREMMIRAADRLANRMDRDGKFRDTYHRFLLSPETWEDES